MFIARKSGLKDVLGSVFKAFNAPGGIRTRTSTFAKEVCNPLHHRGTN